MKKLVTICMVVIFILIGCDNSKTNEDNTAPDNEVENTTSVQEDSNHTESDNENTGTDSASTEQSTNEEMNSVENQDTETLAHFSNEEIEYARIWLQLGPNQEIDKLYIKHIPAGTDLNPDDKTSAGYPEDVIQLSGSRLVDGSITYSGNGDGTINVYNVPLRWDGVYPAGEQFYIDIIQNTKLEYVDPGDDEAVIELIKLQHKE